MMVGDTHKFVCAGCSFIHLGKPDDGKCVKCGCSILKDHGVPEAEDSFPLPKPCPKCLKKLKDIEAIVHLGGAAYRCVSCGAMGAFAKDDDKAKVLRGQDPAKTTFEIDSSQCPQCGKDEEKRSGEAQAG